MRFRRKKTEEAGVVAEPAEPAVRENPSSEFLYANKWRIFGVMMIGWAMSLLDVSIVNVSVPELQDEMSTDLSTVTWVINAYNIIFAVLLVSMGRLADQFGRKRFFVIGMIVFTIGSALCATAWSVEWLIGFRVVQGVGAGILAPLGFAMTVLVFPPQQRGRGLALIAVVALISSALGPVIGGTLVEIASWEWIFLINIPFGIIGILLALRWWPETWDLTAGREVDIRGMLLLGGAVFFLTVALVEANPFAGDLPLWLSLMQGAILLGVLFVWWERKAANPLITPGLFSNRQFRNANIGMLFFGAGAIGSLLLLSLMFVNLWGYSQLEAALAITPVPLMGLVVWPFVGRAADSRPPGDLAKPGLIAMAIGFVIISFMPSTSDDAFSYLRILPGLLLMGVGMGICFPALNVGAMGAVAGPEVGLASGVLNTARQLGAAIGVSVLIATFGGAMHAHMSWFADEEIEDIVDEWEIPKTEAGAIIQATLHDYTGGTEDRFEPMRGFDEEIIRETAGSAREGFAWSFRHAALLVLSVLPLMGALRRTPAQAQAEFMERMRQQQAEAGDGAPPEPGAAVPPPADGSGNGGDGSAAPPAPPPADAPVPPPGARPRPA